MIRAICAMALVGTVFSAEWTMTSVKGITTLIGVGSNAGTEVCAAIGMNGAGAGWLESTDGGASYDSYVPNGDFMNMDIAITSSGVSAMVGMGPLQLKPAGSTQFAPVPNVRGFGQTIDTYLDKGFASAGSWSAGGVVGANGVVVSSDNGASFMAYNAASLNTSTEPARYAAFPSDSVWYVSAGIWPMDDVKVSEHSRRLTSRIVAAPTGHTLLPPRSRSVTDEPTGYTGAIAKTTDGGATWTNVFTTTDYYFNQISCADENTCIAAAENGDASVGYITKDGGANWSIILTEEATGTGSSCVAAFMNSASDFWFAGGAAGGANFYHSTDGSTFEVSTLAREYAFDVTFSDGVGYAAVLNSASCGIAKYA